MGAEATGEKRCSRCGKDVSGRSRAKDAQGNYICAECLDKARTRSQTPRQQQPGGGAVAMAGGGAVGAAALQAPDGGADDLMSKLVQDSIEEGKQGCPNCRTSMKANQRLCVKCGYDREKGSALHTKIEKPVVIKDKSNGSSPLASVGAIASWFINPWVVIGIPALLLGVTFFFAQQDPVQYGLYFGGSVLLIWILATVVLVLEASQDGIVHVLLCLIFPLYSLYYVWVESDNGALKILYVLNVAAAIAARVLVFQTEVS